MLESRLIEHLKLLNAEEIADFLRYAKAMTEYEKGISEDTFLMLRYVCKYLDEEKKLAKEIVYKNLYSKEAWKQGRLDKLMTNSMTLLKSYISFTHYIGKEINDNLALSAFYRRKKQGKFFEANKRGLDRINELVEKPQSDDFLNQFFIVKEVFNFKLENNTRRESLNLPETIFALDTFYLIERLELILISFVQNQFTPFDITSNTSTIDFVLALANHNAYKDNIIIQLFIKAIQLQIETNQEDTDVIFEDFIAIIEENSQISFKLLTLFSTIARNYCVKQYSIGRNEFLLILFNLFKKHLKSGVLFLEGKITASVVQNISIIAIRLKKYDFVHQFLIEHKDKITGTNQPDLIWQYNYALYYLEIGDYQTAYKNLPNYLDFEDNYYILAARRLEIKILYHTEENSRYDTLGNKLDAFKNYLFESNKNKRISELVFNMNNDFVDLLKQIRSTIRKDHARIEKLKEKYQNTPSIAEREWLWEKLEQL